MNNLSNHYNPIRSVRFSLYSLLAMALSEWEFASDDDPWKVSALVSAGVELFLAILLLLSAAIAFFTSRFAKFVGLEPPCTYIGCSHPHHSESPRDQMLHTPSSCKPKDICRGDFYPDCQPLRIHSKSHLSKASIQEEGLDAFESSDCNAGEQDLDVPNGVYGECHERSCSCSEGLWNLGRGAKHTTFFQTASTSKLKKDDTPLPLSRSGSESGSGLDGRGHSEISQGPADSEEEWEWKGTYVKREKSSNSYLVSTHDREAFRRSEVSEAFNEELHVMSPSFLERRQNESAEALSLYAVHNAVEELRVFRYDREHCMQEEDEGVKDECAISNALAEGGGSSEPAGELALSRGDEKEIITEEKQDKGSDSLRLALQDERSVLAALEAELENERNAAAIATNEAMAMISRLQEEKSALQIKVVQLQRMSEEKAEYDEQAMGLLKEILYKRETENIALEKEVELYRETLSDELNKRSWLHKEIESSTPQPLKPLLLTGGEDILSPIEDMRHKQELAFSEKGFQSRISSAPSIRSHEPSADFGELNAFSLDQSMNKRLRLRAWEEEERPRYNEEEDLHGPSYGFEQPKKMGGSFFPMSEESFLPSVLERLWVLEEGLQKLHGKDSAGIQSKAYAAQGSAINATHRREDGSLSGQNKCEIESKEQREEVEMDPVVEGFVPIHDVYEVQSSSNRSPPFAEERGPPKDFEHVSGSLKLPPGGTPESLSRARMAKHRIPISPRFSPAKKLFLSDEAPSTPVFAPPAAGWIVGKITHPDDACDLQDLQAQLVGLTEERGKERGTPNEGIEQLDVRLKKLEEDRELWRECLESFTHRDAEVNLLQEIARHLRELRMAGFVNGLGGTFSEDIVTATSPSKNRPVKKRRSCIGSGLAQMPLLYQRSV